MGIGHVATTTGYTLTMFPNCPLSRSQTNIRGQLHSHVFKLSSRTKCRFKSVEYGSWHVRAQHTHTHLHSLRLNCKWMIRGNFQDIINRSIQKHSPYWPCWLPFTEEHRKTWIVPGKWMVTRRLTPIDVAIESRQNMEKKKHGTHIERARNDDIHMLLVLAEDALFGSRLKIVCFEQRAMTAVPHYFFLLHPTIERERERESSSNSQICRHVKWWTVAWAFHSSIGHWASECRECTSNFQPPAPLTMWQLHHVRDK